MWQEEGQEKMSWSSMFDRSVLLELFGELYVAGYLSASMFVVMMMMMMRN